MDTFLLFGLIGFGCLILGVLGYTATTNKIIKDQEREIEILKTDNERLRSALRGARYVKKLVLQDYKISNPEPAKVKVTNDIIELIRPQRRSYNLQGLYLKDDTPRVIGTKLRRSR